MKPTETITYDKSLSRNSCCSCSVLLLQLLQLAFLPYLLVIFINTSQLWSINHCISKYLLFSLARTEVAEGILEPQESLKLNFNQTCVQSPLLQRLWASAVLCCITGQCLLQVPHSLGIPVHPFTLCPKKHPDAVSCPAPASCLEPPARGAAAVVREGG